MTKEQQKSLVKRLKQAVGGLAGPKHPLQSAAQFERLYQEKHLLVFRHVYGLCGGTVPLAEDFTAETFTRAWQARHSFSGDWSGTTAWLLRIARNCVIDHQRRAIEQKSTALLDEAVAATAATAAGLPEEALVQAEQQAFLIALLQELPLPKREMITLRYLLGWQVREIAHYLEIPENTVSVTIQRTLQHMRQRWPMVAVAKEHDHVNV